MVCNFNFIFLFSLTTSKYFSYFNSSFVPTFVTFTVTSKYILAYSCNFSKRLCFSFFPVVSEYVFMFCHSLQNDYFNALIINTIIILVYFNVKLPFL